MGLCTRSKGDEVKSYGTFATFVYFVNYMIGTGILNLPYVFYSTGIVAAGLTLLFIAGISCCTALWIIEAQARAQALETAKLSQTTTKSLNDIDLGREPIFTLTIFRKFEQTEMFGIFYNRFAKWLYIFVMTVYGFQSQWGAATVAASAWAVNIPFNTSTLHKCSQSDFDTYFNPPDAECANTYRLCVGMFGVIVTVLCLIDIVDQKIIQVTVSLLHFLALGAMVIFGVVGMIESRGLPPHFPNSSETSCSSANSSNVVSLGEAVYQFKFKPWLISIPVFVYAQLTHMGIVTLSAPMRSKSLLKYFFMTLFGFSFLVYFVFSLVLAMYFQSCTSNTVTLNWLPWIALDGVALKVFAFFVILFPPLQMVTGYPLGNAAITHNLYVLLAGKDKTDDKRKYTKIAFFVLTIFCAILPLSLAFAVSNLLYVVQYAGLLGFGIGHLFPALLQFGSQYHCLKKFGADSPSSINSSGESVPLLKEESTLKFLKSWWLTWKNPAYWTPYSSFISHPISAAIICVVGFILFALSIGSLFP